MDADPRKTIAESKMSWLQIASVAILVCVEGLEGFDIASIALASPGIARAWHIKPEELGVVLSAELIGMTVGSIAMGAIADWLGRRRTLLSGMVIMAGGLVLAALSGSVEVLLIGRLLTGFGIGGLLTSVAAAISEHSNRRNKDLGFGLMGGGYAGMLVIAGSIAAVLLKRYDWQSIFALGAALTIIFIPLVWFFVPETIDFLVEKQPRHALEKINRTLKRMGHATVSALPAVERAEKAALTELFRPEMIAATLLIALAYVGHAFTFYYLLKWLPKIIVGFGFTASTASRGMVYFGLGGTLGAVLLGFLNKYSRYKIVAAVFLFLSFVSVACFGIPRANLFDLYGMAAIIGFFTNAGIIALYTGAMHVFPPRMRSTGIGFMLAVGRGGSFASPIIAGVLFQEHVSLMETRA